MAIEAPTNCWTEQEEALALALPQLAAFRQFCRIAADDPDGEEKAAAFVFAEELGESPTGYAWTPEELEQIGQYSIVTSSESEPFRLDRVTTDAFNASGTLCLELHKLVMPDEENTQATERASRNQVDRAFKNRAGSILQELAALWSRDGGPWLRSAMVNDGPFHTHPDRREELGHWQGVEILIAWGLGQER